jgi:hypothetical protein
MELLIHAFNGFAITFASEMEAENPLDAFVEDR